MKTTQNTQSGFTLLELIVVVGLLGLVTSLATEFMVSETNQQRYKTTAERLQKFRYVLIGDSSRTLNGQPDLTGFVHDMGRLPENMDELLAEPADCDGNGNTCTAEFDSSLGRVVGWRGPYIDLAIAQQDGWGFPWQGDISAGTITSYGIDGKDNGTGNTNPYEDNHSLTLREDDYMIQLSENSLTGTGVNGITVNFTADAGICLVPAYTTRNTCIDAGETWTEEVCAILKSVKDGKAEEHISSSTEDEEQNYAPVSSNSSKTFTFYKGNSGSRTPIPFPYGQAVFALYYVGNKNVNCGENPNNVLYKSKRITLAPQRTTPDITF